MGCSEPRTHRGARGSVGRWPLEDFVDGLETAEFRFPMNTSFAAEGVARRSKTLTFYLEGYM